MKFLSAPLAVFFLFAFMEALHASEPYGGYNIDSNPSVAEFLYPNALKKHFDDRASGALPDTPTLGRLMRAEASDAHGQPARGTTHEEMKAFIASLPTDYMRVLTLGEFPSLSASGRPQAAFDLPMLVLANPAAYDVSELKALKKPIVFFQGQIHGDEMSGGEAMLAIASDLSKNRGGILDRVSVIVIPRFNVDGAWRNRRETESAGNVAPNLDPNRDAISVLSPISRAVRNALVTYRPDVFADFHEMGCELYGGAEFDAGGRETGGYKFYYDFDLATLVAHPANVPKGVTKLARELADGVSSDLASSGFRMWRYCDPADMMQQYDVARLDDINVIRMDGSPVRGFATYPKQLVEGAPDESMSDSAAALAPSVSLLFESRSPKVLTNFRTRVSAHYTAGMSVLSQVAARPDEFLNTVASACAEIADMGKNHSDAADVVLWSRQGEEDSPSVTALRLADDKASFEPARLAVEKINTNENLTPVKTVERPYAYIISADRESSEAIASRLALTGVRISRLSDTVDLEVEGYLITSVSRAESASLGYSARSADYFGPYSALTFGIDGIRKRSLGARFKAGTYLFRTAQPSANLGALAVEPLANRNLGNYWNMLTSGGKGAVECAVGFIPAAEGLEYPVYRYMGTAPLRTSEMSTETPMLAGAYVERSVPFDYSATSPDCAFGYDFIARHSSGAVPAFFDAVVPRERNGKKISRWYLYNWTKGEYDLAEVTTRTGVDSIRVRAEHISDAGEVRVLASGG